MDSGAASFTEHVHRAARHFLQNRTSCSCFPDLSLLIERRYFYFSVLQISLSLSDTHTRGREIPLHVCCLIPPELKHCQNLHLSPGTGAKTVCEGRESKLHQFFESCSRQTSQKWTTARLHLLDLRWPFSLPLWYEHIFYEINKEIGGVQSSQLFDALALINNVYHAPCSTNGRESRSKVNPNTALLFLM